MILMNGDGSRHTFWGEVQGRVSVQMRAEGSESRLKTKRTALKAKMKEGWFIRMDTGDSFQIQEHERDARDPELARRLGLPESFIKDFAKYVPVRDRVRFLLRVLQAGVIRARGHGIYATLEYWADDDVAAFRAIHRWANAIGCGDCTLLQMVNLKSKKRFASMFLNFDEAMRNGTAFQNEEVTKE